MVSRKISPETARRIIVFFTFLFAYTYFFHVTEDANTCTRWALIQAIVDDGVLNIDRHHTTTIDKAYYGGHYYSDKAIGAALFGVPAYLLAKKVVDSRNGPDNVAFWGRMYATWWVAALPSAGFVLALFIVLGRLMSSQTWRGLLTLGYGMGTLANPYSQLLYGHQLGAALCFLVCYSAYRVKERGANVGRLLVMGLAGGYAVITEFSSVLILVACCVYLAMVADRPWRVWIPIVTALPVISLQLIYNWKCFDSPFVFAYQHECSKVFLSGMRQGFMGMSYPGGRMLLRRLYEIAFGLYRGLFILSPFLLLAVPGFVSWYLRRKWRLEFWLVLWVVIGFLAFNLSYYMWWGGAGIGPRHLIPALPFMVVAIAFCSQRWRVLGAVLVAVSVILICIPTLAANPLGSEYLSLPELLRAYIGDWRAGFFAPSFGVGLREGRGVATALYGVVWLVAIDRYLSVGRGRKKSQPTPGSPSVPAAPAGS